MIRLSDDFSISEQDLLTGRCCIIGQSGSGKSFLVGVIAEELAREHLPFVVIDTEGEYKSLKSLFEVIWVSDESGADVGMDVDFSALIEKSMLGIPIVFDVSGQQDQVGKVYSFLSELYAVEDRVRKPYLAIIEEADKFAPQVKRGELNIIEEISVRGRKRGLGILVATQRPANISKNVLAQCSYGFIGKLSIENDVNAISILFEDRNMLKELVTLHTGEFMPFGIDSPQKIRIRKRVVEHISSTPELGTLPGGDIHAAIAELKRSSGQAQKRDLSAPIPRIRIIRERFDMSYAQAYASHASRKILPFTGFMVKSVEPRYMRVSSTLVRLPTKRKNVYSEKYIISFGSSLLRETKKGIELYDVGSKKFDKSALSILAEVNSAGSVKLGKLEQEFGQSSSKSVERLADAGRLEVRKDKVTRFPWKRFMREAQYETGESSPSQITPIKPKTKISSRELIRSIIPEASIVRRESAYLKVYEITLRRGSTVKVLFIDSLTGKEIRLQ